MDGGTAPFYVESPNKFSPSVFQAPSIVLGGVFVVPLSCATYPFNVH
jgi:hypothetical protein